MVNRTRALPCHCAYSFWGSRASRGSWCWVRAIRFTKPILWIKRGIILNPLVNRVNLNLTPSFSKKVLDSLISHTRIGKDLFSLNLSLRPVGISAIEETFYAQIYGKMTVVAKISYMTAVIVVVKYFSISRCSRSVRTVSWACTSYFIKSIFLP